MSPEAKAEQRRRDDRLALAATLLGAGIAFVGFRTPITLASGFSLGMGGALMALRGERAIEARGWLVAALGIAVVAVGACVGLGFYEEWVAGQWFAEGAQPGMTRVELQRIHETASLLRTVGLASSLALLLGAMVSRLRK